MPINVPQRENFELQINESLKLQLSKLLLNSDASSSSGSEFKSEGINELDYESDFFFNSPPSPKHRSGRCSQDQNYWETIAEMN